MRSRRRLASQAPELVTFMSLSTNKTLRLGGMSVITKGNNSFQHWQNKATKIDGMADDSALRARAQARREEPRRHLLKHALRYRLKARPGGDDFGDRPDLVNRSSQPICHLLLAPGSSVMSAMPAQSVR
jgi:hypothetical protein